MKKELLCSLLFPSMLFAANTKGKPNIILILIDDAGYADFGFSGSKEFKTPNIDRIANNGLVFTDMHASASVSGPSRSGLMTGRYQQRFGCETNTSLDIVGVPTNERFFSEILQLEGYKTAAFGKWHLGSTFEQHPNSRGFDEFYGFLGGARGYFFNESFLNHETKGIMHNREYVRFDGYLTDVFADKAVDFIDENKKNPFFIYLSFNAVHSPFEAKDSDIALFKNTSRPTLAAMTWALDRAIGKVLNKLEDEHIIDNTLIMFMSDNGGDFSKGNSKDNYPLKSEKGLEFEGGHRVICTFRWDNVIPKHTRFDGLSSMLDIFPTVLNVSGSDYKSNKKVDGVNLIPFILGKKNNNPHEWLFWRIERWKAVRYNNFKLVSAQGVGDRMYDLSNDINETIDLRHTHSELYKEMKKRLYEWEDVLIQPIKRGESKWKDVKASMYKAYFNNEIPKRRTP